MCRFPARHSTALDFATALCAPHFVAGTALWDSPYADFVAGEHLASWTMSTGDFALCGWSWKLRTGDFLVQLQDAEQSVELEADNWRLSSTTLVRGAICGAGS